MKIYAVSDNSWGSQFEKFFTTKGKARKWLKEDYLKTKEQYKDRIVEKSDLSEYEDDGTPPFKFEKDKYYIAYWIRYSYESGEEWDIQEVVKEIVEIEVEE